MEEAKQHLMLTHACIIVLTFISSIVLLSSCAVGEDSTPFTSDVKNATLANPDSITFAKNAAETELTISWKVVHGAKGYEFTLYNVDDPDKPVVVGEEKQLVDGLSATRELMPDTKYRVSLRTIGDAQYNNSDAPEAGVIEYSTLVPAVAKIPAGTDISTFLNDWLAKNPLYGKTEDGTYLTDSTEIAFELEAGGSYTMSAPVDFGKYWVTLRGSKVSHAKLALSGSALFSTTSGLKLKFMDMDCAAMTSDALLTLSATPDERILGTGSYYIIPESKPIVISSCNISKLPNRLFFENIKKKYCVGVALINDCKVELTTTNTTQISYIDFNKQGFINDLSIKGCTFYYNGTGAKNNYFVRYSNSARPDRAGFANAYLNYTTSTFYNVCNGGQMGNYGSFARNTIIYTLKKCIFQDCGSGQVVRRFLAGRNSSQMTTDFSQNTYVYNGKIGEADYDKSGTALSTDPNFVDAANANFTPQGADQLQYLTGDPRWLPATTASK